MLNVRPVSKYTYTKLTRFADVFYILSCIGVLFVSILFTIFVGVKRVTYGRTLTL